MSQYVSKQVNKQHVGDKNGTQKQQEYIDWTGELNKYQSL